MQVFFTVVADARDKLEHWRLDCNQVHPHSALADRAPEEFADGWQTVAIETASSDGL